MRRTCEADYGHHDTPCGKPATTRRKRGVVEGYLYLCAEDARIYDDIQAEGRAEAALS